MSNIIETRHYAHPHGALLQQRPRDIENVVDTSKRFGKMVTATAAACIWAASSPTNSLIQSVDPDTSWSRWVDQSKEALQKATAKEPRPATAAARFRVDRLTALQASFGFTTQDLASILGISRQQLYKWLDAAKDVQMQEVNRERLSTAERIAKEWTSRSQVPLSSVSREALAGDKSIFAMMSEEVIDETMIVSHFDELIAKLQTKPKTRSMRLREAGFTRRASSLPSDE